MDEDNLFSWAGNGPESEQAFDQRDVQLVRLFQVVLDAQLELCVVSCQCLHFVQGDQDFGEETLVLLLERCG